MYQFALVNMRNVLLKKAVRPYQGTAKNGHIWNKPEACGFIQKSILVRIISVLSGSANASLMCEIIHEHQKSWCYVGHQFLRSFP